MKAPKEIIINDKIKLMHIRDEDAKRLVQLGNQKIFRKNVGDTFPYPYTLEDAKRWIDHSRKAMNKNDGERNYGIYIKSEDGKFEYAGNLGWQIKEKGRKSNNYHIGYRIGEPYRGKGYMTGIVTGLTSWMFDNIAECHRIYALAFSWNKGSARVLEKSGFTKEATLREAICWKGEWHDEWMYGKLRGE